MKFEIENEQSEKARPAGLRSNSRAACAAGTSWPLRGMSVLSFTACASVRDAKHAVLVA